MKITENYLKELIKEELRDDYQDPRSSLYYQPGDQVLVSHRGEWVIGTVGRSLGNTYYVDILDPMGEPIEIYVDASDIKANDLLLDESNESDWQQEMEGKPFLNPGFPDVGIIASESELGGPYLYRAINLKTGEPLLNGLWKDHLPEAIADVTKEPLTEALQATPQMIQKWARKPLVAHRRWEELKPGWERIKAAWYNRALNLGIAVAGTVGGGKKSGAPYITELSPGYPAIGGGPSWGGAGVELYNGDDLDKAIQAAWAARENPIAAVLDAGVSPERFVEYLSEAARGNKKAKLLKETDIENNPKLEFMVDEFAALSMQIDKLKAELKDLDKRYDGLFSDIVAELGKVEDNALRTQQYFIKIKRQAYEKTNYKYKEAFDWLYGRVNEAMKNIVNEAKEATKSVTNVAPSIAAQKNEGVLSHTFGRAISYARNVVDKVWNKIRGENKKIEQALKQFEKMVPELDIEYLNPELAREGE